jgi:hypothetical protein
MLDLPGLGASDRLHVGTCAEHGIDTIVSADADFDRVKGLRRIDPLDAPGRAPIAGGLRALTARPGGA